jgi:hypothetical protein
MPPRWAFLPDRLLHERIMSTVRAKLGEEAFEAARSEGRAMLLDEAVAYGLSAKE